MLTTPDKTIKDKKSKRKSKDFRHEITRKDEEGSNFGEDKGRPKENDPRVLKIIVHDFSTSSQDLATVQSLILAHEHFVKSEVLMEAFILEFATIKKEDQINQFRVTNFLKKWIDLERGKFINKTEGIGKRLDDFINSLPEALGKTLATAVADETTKTGLNDDLDEDDDEEAIPPIITKKKKGTAAQILSFDPLEIARQLTLIDHRNICEVNLKELLKTNWLKNAGPSLNKNAGRANTLAHWMAYEFLLCKPKHRTKLLTHYLRICHGLQFLQNYQSLMAIYLGLNLSPVFKLIEPLIEQLPAKAKAIWESVSNFLAFQNNYHAYREIVKKKIPPMIPCQEIFLKDLLYHDESFPNYTNEGHVDVNKLHVMGNIINSFRKCQMTKYRLQESKELYEYLLNIPDNVTVESLEKLALNPSPDNLNVEITGETSTSSMTDISDDSYLEKNKAKNRPHRLSFNRGSEERPASIKFPNKRRESFSMDDSSSKPHFEKGSGSEKLEKEGEERKEELRNDSSHSLSFAERKEKRKSLENAKK
jgi:hypothetical protein